MKKLGLIGGVVVVVALLIVANMSLYTVYQTQQALVLQFGNPVGVEDRPGLHFKLPWRNVEYYEQRILDLDPPPQEIILRDQKRINVDAFARYKIKNPLVFRQRALTDANFRQIFGGRLNAAIRDRVGQVLLGDMLTANRTKVMSEIDDQMKSQAEEFGIEVIDVRIGRTDLPAATSQSVYNRMRSDRIAYAAEIRAQGEEKKLEIEAQADRERTVILAEARKTSETLRGEGDAQRTRLLVDAYGQDPDFFAFYRSMEAYGAALGEGTTLVLSPDSDFFRFFGDRNGGKE
ncbi:MAG: protease modulator HflC [Magnetospiraceae bacterium]